MTTDALVVLMDDDVAGTLTRLRDRRLRFDYDDAYSARPDATPLSLSMPLQVDTHSDRVITPWLWGLLPDNSDVLDRWAREFDVAASSPFTLLSTPVGEDCAGTVRFCAPDRVDALLAKRGRIEWLTDDELAAHLRDLRRDTTAWLGTAFTGRFSLAGAQAKTALLYREGRWGVPSGRIATTHILKPAIAGFADFDLNEHLCLEAAARAGLIVARSRIVRVGGEQAVAVERYDRRTVGNKQVRVHQEDVAQALGVHPARKYQAEGGPGPIEIVRLLRGALPARVAAEAVERFVAALAWNWVIGGTDAHAKNYSLLLAGAEVRLAPLYDIASALPYAPDPMKLKLAMKVGGEYRLKAHRARSWARTAGELGLDADDVRSQVQRLAEQAPDALRDAAADPEVAALRSKLPRRLVDAVAARAASCAAMLRRS